MSVEVAQGSSTESVTEVTAPAVTESSSPAPAAAPEEPKIVTPPEPTGLDRLRKLAEGELPMKKGKKAAEVTPTAGEPAPKAPETPALETPKPGEEVAPKPGETPAFKPNFKFKVMDKEHEIPELLRGVMKDAESEKLVRELHEKAYGLDIVKPRLLEERQKRQEAVAKNDQILGGIAQIKQLYQRGDMEGWFRSLGVPQEKVLQWVIDKLNYQELPPEQRQVLDQRKTAEERAWQAEQQASSLQQKYEQETLNARDIQLTSTLDRADIKAAMQAFDSRPGGKPGDFREAICERGETTWLRSQGKIDLTPEQAALEVIRLYGIQPLQAAPAATPAAPAAPAPAATQTPAAAPRTVPVIPNVAGTSTSPMKTKPRSLADLKKLAAEMA